MLNICRNWRELFSERISQSSLYLFTSKRMKEKATILEINNIDRILTLVSKKVSTVTKSTMVFGEWDSVAPQNVQIRVSFSVFVGSFQTFVFSR